MKMNYTKNYYTGVSCKKHNTLKTLLLVGEVAGVLAPIVKGAVSMVRRHQNKESFGYVYKHTSETLQSYDKLSVRKRIRDLRKASDDPASFTDDEQREIIRFTRRAETGLNELERCIDDMSDDPCADIDDLEKRSFKAKVLVDGALNELKVYEKRMRTGEEVSAS